MISAIIFDMDGVISDTQKLHAQVESNLLRQYGVILSPEEITKKYAGVRSRDFLSELLNEKKATFDIDEIMNQKWGKMEQLAGLGVDEIPGAIDLIKNMHDLGIILSVASASTSAYVQTVLSCLKITSYFSAIVTGDMVVHGKPDPEILLLASKKMNVDPHFCVVIEDAVSGMTSAVRANMSCIGLVSDKDLSYPTKNLVTSLSEITQDYLNKISLS